VSLLERRDRKDRAGQIRFTIEDGTPSSSVGGATNLERLAKLVEGYQVASSRQLGSDTLCHCTRKN
jgi:hypothetical protein